MKPEQPASSASATLLLIVGADRDGQIYRDGSSIRIGGSSDIFGLLGKTVPFHRLHLTRHYFRQQRRPELSQYRCMMNLITEPEQNGRVLAVLAKLTRGVPARLLNRPDAVLKSSRDQVARRLANIPGLCVPKVLRFKASKEGAARQAIAKAGLSFPIIVRQAGAHTGKTVDRFDVPEQLDALPLDSGDRFATEYVDFRSADGLYRKYRVFFIGRHLIFRHLIASDQWNIHAQDRLRFMIRRPELLEEEKPLFERPEGNFPEAVLESLRVVRERMELDFFGVDFGLLPDGRLLLFEANASMNFFPFLTEPEFAYVQRCWEPARQAFRALVGIGRD